jgi:hypothetical protein
LEKPKSTRTVTVVTEFGKAGKPAAAMLLWERDETPAG